MRSYSFVNLLVFCVEMLSIGFGMRNEYCWLNVLSLSKAYGKLFFSFSCLEVSHSQHHLSLALNKKITGRIYGVVV